MSAAVWGKILQLVGGIVSAGGQYGNEMSRAQQLRFESEMAMRNAELVKQDIQIVKSAGRQERANIDIQAHDERGAARASFASGNVAVDEGSAVDYDALLAQQAASEREASKDIEDLATRKLKNEQLGLLAESKLKRRAYKSQKRSAGMGAVGGVISAIGGGMGGK